MSRKAEVVAIAAASAERSSQRRAGRRLARTTLVRSLRPPFGSLGSRVPRGEEALPMNSSQNDTQPWQLIHDDPFDRATSDQDIERVVTTISARTDNPYTEVLRRLVGVDHVDEAEARTFFREVIEHRRNLIATLARPVHIRVAALDLLTMRPMKSGVRRDSHPIIVTSSLLEKAFEVATADGVTGLPQRAQFMNLLRHELRQRKRRSICVAFIDLDGFKRVNDQHGHARGDEVLRALAQSARGSLREGDVLARFGGDEFAVLLLDATPDEADAALRRLRDQFEMLTRPLGTSFSSGIALAGAGEAAERVIVRADQAMYRQKKSRSNVVLG